MTAPRFRSLSVKGFRSYGAAEQTLNLPGELAVVWGPNSKGKSSLAEAVEFLLTGRTARRELMASSQDEFADALRNAHLADGEDVHVAASVIAADGTRHDIKRTLIADYAKRQNCRSRLEVDGAPVAESALAALGFVLSQPPLDAPVLAQHTLSYIFSVRPQDRSTYFKTLLDVNELDDLRNEVASLSGEVTALNDPLLAKFDACLVVPVLRSALAPAGAVDVARVTAGMTEGARALLQTAGAELPDVGQEYAALKTLLEERRSKAFPVRGFARQELPGWTPPRDEVWTRLSTYLLERSKVDEEARELVGLFTEALKIPHLAGITEPMTCPLCGNSGVLTPTRVSVIRRHIEETRNFGNSERDARAALSHLAGSAEAMVSGMEAALPAFLKTKASVRRLTGFTVSRIRDLLQDRAEEVLRPWLIQVRSVAQLPRRCDVRCGVSIS